MFGYPLPPHLLKNLRNMGKLFTKLFFSAEVKFFLKKKLCHI